MPAATRSATKTTTRALSSRSPKGALARAIFEDDDDDDDFLFRTPIGKRSTTTSTTAATATSKKKMAVASAADGSDDDADEDELDFLFRTPVNGKSAVKTKATTTRKPTTKKSSKTKRTNKGSSVSDDENENDDDDDVPLFQTKRVIATTATPKAKPKSAVKKKVVPKSKVLDDKENNEDPADDAAATPELGNEKNVNPEDATTPMLHNRNDGDDDAAFQFGTTQRKRRPLLDMTASKLNITPILTDSDDEEQKQNVVPRCDNVDNLMSISDEQYALGVDGCEEVKKLFSTASVAPEDAFAAISELRSKKKREVASKRACIAYLWCLLKDPVRRRNVFVASPSTELSVAEVKALAQIVILAAHSLASAPTEYKITDEAVLVHIVNLADLLSDQTKLPNYLPSSTCDSVLRFAYYALFQHVWSTMPTKGIVWECATLFLQRPRGAVPQSVANDLSSIILSAGQNILNCAWKDHKSIVKTAHASLSDCLNKSKGLPTPDQLDEVLAALTTWRQTAPGHLLRLHFGLTLFEWVRSRTSKKITQDMATWLDTVAAQLHLEGETPLALRLWTVTENQEVLKRARLRHSLKTDDGTGGMSSDVVTISQLVWRYRKYHDHRTVYADLVNLLTPYAKTVASTNNNNNNSNNTATDAEVRSVRTVEEAHDVAEGLATLCEIMMSRGEVANARRIMDCGMRLILRSAEICTWRGIVQAFECIANVLSHEQQQNAVLAAHHRKVAWSVLCEMSTEAQLSLTPYYTRLSGATGQYVELVIPQSCLYDVGLIENCNKYLRLCRDIKKGSSFGTLIAAASTMPCPFYSDTARRVLELLCSARKTTAYTLLKEHGGLGLLDVHRAECSGCSAQSQQVLSVAQSEVWLDINDRAAAADVLVPSLGIPFESIWPEAGPLSEDFAEFLPPSTVLVSMSLDAEGKTMYVTRHSKEGAMSTSLCETVAYPWRELLQEFASVMQGSSQEIKDLLATYNGVEKHSSEQKHKFWDIRRAHDHKLKEIIAKLTDSAFGIWRCLLVGNVDVPAFKDAIESTVIPDHADKLCKALGVAEVNVPLMSLLLHSVPFLSRGAVFSARHSDKGLGYWEDTQALLLEGIAKVHHRPVKGVGVDEKALFEITRSLRRATLAMFEEHVTTVMKRSILCAPRERVWLLLDPSLQAFPIESMSIFSNTPVVRIPSLRFALAICTHRRRQLPRSPSDDEIFYVLNPSGDVVRTQSRFEPVFNERGWRGITGRNDVEATLDGLRSSDVYMYLGHGSGERCTPRSSLVNPDGTAAMDRFARTAIMMGCSSSRVADGPTAMPLTLLLAGATMVVCTLWDVTDGELDRCTLDIIEKHWPHVAADDTKKLQFSPEKEAVGGREGGTDPMDSLEVRARLSRASCRLPFLTGASFVVYGV